MSGSFIYRHVWCYRLVMNVLYRGRYRARFEAVTALLREQDRSVLELCFGDGALAARCRASGRSWIGLDVSGPFVAKARAQGFDARQADLSRVTELPRCDVCVMMGSLYHFHRRLPELFTCVKAASSRFLLSEPVRNWTHGNRVQRYLARKATRAGRAEETFRFDEASLTAALEELSRSIGFGYRVVGVARDMVVEVVWSK